MVHGRRLLRLAGLALCAGLLCAGLLLRAGPVHAAGGADAPLAHAVDGDEERVLVLLPAQDYRAPDIEVLAGDSPRVVADFSGVPAWGGPAALEVGSPLLLRVRTWLHSDEQRLRVVLDLAADPSGLLITHTYEPENGAVRAAIILLPVGPRQE